MEGARHEKGFKPYQKGIKFDLFYLNKYSNLNIQTNSKYYLFNLI